MLLSGRPAMHASAVDGVLMLSATADVAGGTGWLEEIIFSVLEPPGASIDGGHKTVPRLVTLNPSKSQTALRKGAQTPLLYRPQGQGDERDAGGFSKARRHRSPIPAAPQLKEKNMSKQPTSPTSSTSPRKAATATRSGARSALCGGTPRQRFRPGDLRPARCIRPHRLHRAQGSAGVDSTGDRVAEAGTPRHLGAAGLPHGVESLQLVSCNRSALSRNSPLTKSVFDQPAPR